MSGLLCNIFLSLSDSCSQAFRFHLFLVMYTMNTLVLISHDCHHVLNIREGLITLSDTSLFLALEALFCHGLCPPEKQGGEIGE